ncbi:MAG TPA: hypothetical protein VKA84_08265 [Gemmatimonadaceae bacterium]|nr:hypothetical protein [Gemmatimonadaceae bacterium]
MRRLLLLGLPMLFACARGRPAAAPASSDADAAPFPVVDLMPRFWAFWDQDRPAAGADSAELVRRFRERVVRPDSVFYARAAGGPSDDRIRAFLGRVGKDVPAMRVVSERLEHDLGRFSRSFADSFPDFDFRGLVFFYPSLYVRDGGTMDYPPGVALMFGIDVIARVHGPEADLAVLFDHELFHLYHVQVRPLRREGGPPPLFRRIWGEGLATYVSQRMNPRATELALLLNDRALLAARTRLPELADSVLAHLDDTSSAYARRYLQGGTNDPAIPARAGYLVGLRAAQLIGRRRALPELARLPDDSVRAEMTRALRALAAGAVPPGSRRPQPLPPRGVRRPGDPFPP